MKANRRASKTAIKNLCDACGYTFGVSPPNARYTLFKNGVYLVSIGREQPITTWIALIGAYESGGWTATQIVADEITPLVSHEPKR